MQNITLIVVGNLKEKYWRDAAAEYEKRLSAFCKFQIIEIGEERLPDHPGEAVIAKALSQEGERIRAKIPAGAYVTALCIEGGEISSPDFSRLLSKTALDGFSHLVFIIGGSFGICPELKARSDRKLSFSPMTFPHQLFRIMLLEQLYRGFQIMHGGKYHK